MKAGFEKRLDTMREEARAGRAVSGLGVDVSGGPIPAVGPAVAGYAGESIVKPPVWTWEIPVYFFVGGLCGMAAIIGAVAWLLANISLARAALWIAAAGAIVSPILLIMDLGRPVRFLYMLRVFKWRSPMSMGAWILSAYGAHAVPGVIVFELLQHDVFHGSARKLLGLAAILLAPGGAFWGMLLATYTGVLIGVSVIPAWHLHRHTLPIHFGTVGLGSAVALLELFGYRGAALGALAYLAASVETLLWLLLELRRHGAADRAVHEGRSSWLIRISDLCTGPLSLALRALGWIPVAALFFLAGGLLSRFGWLAAGRASGRDPASVLASQ
jgi:formate-dependent nitrite reductase membrane component NrfD